ncbi:unnamed protein product [Nezara viridula]|uniref:Uncharacterized protein n=1 Tax=Nezara viridula TaxID=85310 RepID=A0A9P0H3B7_NEZVI|nr:unnamed protein product [Nezara viridula]
MYFGPIRQATSSLHNNKCLNSWQETAWKAKKKRIDRFIKGKPWDLTSQCKEPAEWTEPIVGVQELNEQHKAIGLPFFPITTGGGGSSLGDERPTIPPHFLHHFYPFTDLSQLHLGFSIGHNLQ